MNVGEDVKLAVLVQRLERHLVLAQNFANDAPEAPAATRALQELDRAQEILKQIRELV